MTLLVWSHAATVAAQAFVEPEGDDPRVTIDRVVIGLLIIATVLSLLTLGYIWHTQPQRRADARLRKEQAQRDGVDAGVDLQSDGQRDD